MYRVLRMESLSVARQTFPISLFGDSQDFRPRHRHLLLLEMMLLVLILSWKITESNSLDFKTTFSKLTYQIYIKQIYCTIFVYSWVSIAQAYHCLMMFQYNGVLFIAKKKSNKMELSEKLSSLLRLWNGYMKIYKKQSKLRVHKT